MSAILEGNSDSHDFDEEDSRLDLEEAPTAISHNDPCPRVPSTTSTSQSSSSQPQQQQPKREQSPKHQEKGQSVQDNTTIQQDAPQPSKPQLSSHQHHHSNGYYDAEKCRAHIANQIRVSKIDRFAAQVNKAVEIESSVYNRLSGIFNMFMNISAQVTYEFTMRCKMSLKRHRQDRILARSGSKKSLNSFNNSSKLKIKLEQQHSKSGSKITKPSFANINTNIRPTRIKSDKFCTIGNDLLYGHGVQLLQTLFAQTIDNRSTSNIANLKGSVPGFIDNDKNSRTTCNQIESPSHQSKGLNLSFIDNSLLDSFEPDDYVRKLEDFIRKNMRKSRLINSRLSTIRQVFERLASEHRDKVDLVYTAEEERQSTTVVRRSAYNLSLAAIKATRTPIHVNFNSNDNA